MSFYYPSKTELIISATIKSSSLTAFNCKHFKILLFGKEIIYRVTHVNSAFVSSKDLYFFFHALISVSICSSFFFNSLFFSSNIPSISISRLFLIFFQVCICILQLLNMNKKRTTKLIYVRMFNSCRLTWVKNISMGECNTILSAYTKYRHLG